MTDFSLSVSHVSPTGLHWLYPAPPATLELVVSLSSSLFWVGVVSDSLISCLFLINNNSKHFLVYIYMYIYIHILYSVYIYILLVYVGFHGNTLGVRTTATMHWRASWKGRDSSRVFLPSRLQVNPDSFSPRTMQKLTRLSPGCWKQSLLNSHIAAWLLWRWPQNWKIWKIWRKVLIQNAQVLAKLVR